MIYIVDIIVIFMATLDATA